MKSALFIVKLETQFLTLIRVAKLLKNKGYNVRFYFDDVLDYRLARMISVCKKERISYVSFQNKENTNIPIIKRNSLIKKLFNSFVLVYAYFFPLLHNFCIFYNFYLKQIEEAKMLIKTNNPELIVTSESGIGGNSAIDREARKHAIPIIVFPYEYSTIDQLLLLEVFEQHNWQKSYSLKSWLNRFIAKVYSHWAYIGSHHAVLRYPNARILAEEVLGLAPKLPWTVQGGYYDYMAVESKFMWKHYLQEGIPEEKLILTGTVFDDTIKKKLESKKEDIKRLGCSTNRKLILCSLPKDMTDGKKGQFNSYFELLDFFIQHTLKASEKNIIYQAHPDLRPEHLDYIKSKDIIFSTKNIADLIPLCDLLITCVSSSIRMAIACGIPVLNFDVYKFGFRDYNSVVGVITVEEKKDFLKFLTKLTCNTNYFNKIKIHQQSCAKEWGLLDGKSNARILGLFDSVQKKR